MIKLPPRPVLPKVIKAANNDLSNELSKPESAKVVCIANNIQKETSQTLKEPKRRKVETKELFLDDIDRESSFAQVQQWFKMCLKSTCQKPLLLVGPTGSGKTALIKHYAFENNLDLEMPEDLDEDSFGHSFFKGPLVIDGFDTLEQGQKSILKKKLQSKRPIIILAEDRFADCVKSIQKACTFVALDRPSKSFIKKVLRASRPQENELLDNEIATSANGNLGIALAINYWTSRTKSTSGASQMFSKVPLDVQKATRSLLCGQSLECIGDASFLIHVLQTNLLPVANQASASLNQIARSLESFSILDTIDSKKWFTTEELWSFTDTLIKQGPKLNAQQAPKFSYEWPRSTKKSEMPKYIFS